jgi:hypothetical protein
VGNNGSEGTEHGYIGLSGPDAEREGAFDVVEGGQLSRHGKGFSIQLAEYVIHDRGPAQPGHWWAGRSTARTQRRLQGYIDLTAVPYTQRAQLPA